MPSSTGSIYSITKNSLFIHQGAFPNQDIAFHCDECTARGAVRNGDVCIINTGPVTVHCGAALFRRGAVFIQSTFHGAVESRNSFAVNNSNDHVQPNLRLGQIGTMRRDNDRSAITAFPVSILARFDCGQVLKNCPENHWKFTFCVERRN